MGMSLAQLLVVLMIILVLFGAGRLPKVMADLGKGFKSFKDSINTDADDNNK